MIRNYFKIAWRNIRRQKSYAFINIAGLAIGVAACLLILQYVSFELSYENFQENGDRIYRVHQDRYDNGKLSTQWAGGAYAVGNSFKDAIPEIEEYVKVVPENEVTAVKGDQPVKFEKVYFTTASFFDVFTFPLLEGDAKTALKEPYTVALSESTARLLFGTTDVIGKKLELNRRNNYTITAVYRDAPENTQIRPEMLLSYETFIKFQGPDNNPEQAWAWDGCLTYLLLKKGADPKTVEAKFPPIVEKGVGELMKRFNASVTYSLLPLGDIHLHSHFLQEPGPTGDGKTTYLLLGIAFFIAVIAWVNYVNLATARAVGRAREVGIRKTIGSRRRQLVFQFLAESAVLNALALLLAVVLVMIAIPGFNRLSGQHLSFSLFATKGFWLGMVGLFVTGIIMSGLYPAFILSGFKPIQVLKGKVIASRQGSLLRKGLVVFQFAASLFLLIGTVAVFKQIKFMQSQSLGINIDQMLVVKPPVVGIDSTYMQKLTAFKDELKTEVSVGGVAVSTSVPGSSVDWNAGGIKLVGAPESDQKQYRVIGVDYDFLGMYGFQVVAGRAFSRDFGSDPQAVIFNRKAVEQLGFNDPAEAIGKQIDFWGQQYTIAGVIENFHQQSLREAYEPLILRLIPAVRGMMSIKTPADRVDNTIAAVKTKWAKFFPGNTFEYFFLDDHFDEQYRADQRFGGVFTLFTSLAILVACLGLFGLASFTTIQRTREIGIRKVLGASVPGILKLLYREFAWLLLIAFVIAVPLSWLMIQNWLQAYAFRIDIHWSFFVLPFMVIILVALLTVSMQSIKAALANPVQSLRTE